MSTNTEQPSSGLIRWLALAAVLINVFFNYYINASPITGQTIGEVSGKYPTLITPAGYAFSIWGVIYLSFILYAIYQVLPSQRNKHIYNRLAIPLIATSILSIVWLILFSLEYMGASVLVILGMLVTAILLFGWSKQASFRKEASFWIAIPFGLYMAWLSVATIINVAVWLTDMGWRGSASAETTWTVVMLGVALAAGIFISRKFNDLSYPAVIAWATFAIYAARQGANVAVAMAALVAGIVLVVWVIGYGIRLTLQANRRPDKIRYETGDSAWSYKNR